ncbi:MOSC domain-containing protein [Loktanella sp. TSTF-M6]|uniref:MOSC domain-containing protein n=1 Tax=Loktanella gaetbuli TaxID=2881335 RepID=A0ABS8BPR4_9RHOB|nr:MOSC domain-containing protein [Loktanella gaetbuli]MCB5197713.1 MOSC domain-containing protein [Loktanella gaetbuli]
MMARHAQIGRLDWIGLRPERRAEVLSVARATIAPDGLNDDHARPGKRAVTLVQAEHLPVIAALSGHPVIAPETLRRNLVVSGINLAALRNGQLRIGDVILMIEGPCPPCSRMEEYLGHGGYNAVRGHGGWYASVVTPGAIAVGDAVVAG